MMGMGGLFSFLKKKQNSSSPVVLVFRVGQLGDSLIAMPAIHAIRKKHPDHRLVLMTDRQIGKGAFVSSWDVLGPTGWFDEVIFYNTSIECSNPLVELLRLIPILRNLTCEYVYNLAPERSSRQIQRDRFYFSQIVGASNYFGPKVYIPAKKINGKLPAVDPEWKLLLCIVGIIDEPDVFVLPIASTFQDEALQVMTDLGINTREMLIAIGPGSKMQAKVWPEENYAALGDRILDHYPKAKLLVLGGKEDRTLGDRLCSKWSGRAYNLAGLLSVYGSAAVMKDCKLYIGNDTGTMHLAGMIGTPCVAIFSARDYPGKWDPYGQKNLILRCNKECEGCMLCECDENPSCVELVCKEDVFEACKGYL